MDNLLHIFTSSNNKVNIQKNETMQLSKKAIEAIKAPGNGELYGKIADHLGVSAVGTLADKLRRNDSDFTQIGVINLIKQYTGLTEDEILVAEAVS